MSVMTLPFLCSSHPLYYPHPTNSRAPSPYPPHHQHPPQRKGAVVWETARFTGSSTSNGDRYLWSPPITRNPPHPSGSSESSDLSEFMSRLSVSPPPPSAQRSSTGYFPHASTGAMGRPYPTLSESTSFNPFEDEDDANDVYERVRSRYDAPRSSHSTSSSSRSERPHRVTSAAPRRVPPIKIPTLPLLASAREAMPIAQPSSSSSVAHAAAPQLMISIPSAEPSPEDPQGEVARVLLVRANRHRTRTRKCDETRGYQRSNLSAVIYGSH